MTTKTLVLTTNVPAPMPGIFSQAIVANGFVYASGMIPLDPKSGKLIEGDIKFHTHQCIRNIGAVLEAAGSSLQSAIEVNVYLSDTKDFDEMNEVYKKYWGDVKPACTCVALKTLPAHADVEI